jgi:predicted transposase/invertase (TIGR01784 family)
LDGYGVIPAVKRRQQDSRPLSSARKEGLEKGHEEGQEEGLEKGKLEGKLEDAQAMLKEGIPLETVA